MKPTKERIAVGLDTLETELNVMRHFDHIRRYQLIKRYCYGKVVDAACGVGYGSHLLSDNPDITGIIGVDNCDEAIGMANAEYADDKVTFVKHDVTDLSIACDTFVSIETMEHIGNLDAFADSIRRCTPNIVIVSFPDKASTHFNEFHVHDLKKQDVVDLLDGFCCVREIEENDVKILVFVKLGDGIPAHIFR